MNCLLVIVIINVLLLSSLTEQLEISNGNKTSDDLVLKSVDDKKEFPKETQMAQCTIQTTDGLKVQAQATFSKKLDGFCSTGDMRTMEDRIVAMERRLLKHIYNLQILIQKLLPPNSYDFNDLNDEYFLHSRRDYVQEQNQARMPVYTTSNYQDFDNNKFNYIPTTTTPITPTQTSPKVVNANMLKSLDRNPKNDQNTAKPSTEKLPEEVTAKIIPKNEYTFYWKLDNFPKVFQNAKKNEIFSHVFNVKGLYIRIRAMLNLKEDETLLLDVEHLAENTDRVEVEISDGLIFKEIVEERIFQYIFVILDQNNPNHIHVSPSFWNNENENYLIPNIQLLRNFLKDNSLLIKLVITF